MGKSLTPDKYEKINIAGFDIYFDKDLDFIENPAHFNRIQRTLRSTIVVATTIYLKGIVPLRKPKIVITDLTDQPNAAYRKGDSVPAYYQDGVIYIDEYKIHNSYLLVHEYAHFLADRVKTQTQPLLRNAYNNMLDAYYNDLNKRKIKLKDKQTDSKASANEKIIERQKIAKKLGFRSQYAFNDFDEFFAEVIASWKELPNNAITYRFKQAVKSVLNRL